MRKHARKWKVILWSVLGCSLLVPLQDTTRANGQVEYERARQLFLRGSLEKCELEAEREYRRFRTEDANWAARFRLLEAEAMIWRGMYDKGLLLLAAEPSTLNSPDDRISILALAGGAHAHLQDFKRADQELSQAEALCGTPSQPNSCGAVLRARGILSIERGQFVDANRYFLESLSFARAHQDRLLESNAYLNLGAVALQESRYDEALDWSKLAYSAAGQLGNENRAQIALGNLGWAYFGLGDSERALDLFTEAERRAARLGNLRNQVKWLTTAANVYQGRGDSTQAALLFKQALALAHQINSKEDIVNSLEDLAHASLDAGKIDDAARYVRELDPLVTASGNRLDILDVQFAKARIAAAQHQDQDAERLYRGVEGDPASQTSMRLGAEHELARLYETQGNPDKADRMYRASLDIFEAARAELKNEDSKLPFLANATAIYDDYIHFLVQRGRSAEALALADQSRARTLAQGLGVASGFHAGGVAEANPQTIARKMNATLLFYWMGRSQSYLWAVTANTVQLTPLPAEHEIVPMLTRYRKALLGLGDPVENRDRDGIALYQALVAPAANVIKPASTVVLLDDGPLSQLNFETLIVPGASPHYWIEDATLISAPSLYMLASAKPAASGNRKLLLVGDAISPSPDYPELPMAANEMKQIAQSFATKDKTVFERERATPATYLGSSPQQFAYIHFVAHGVASTTDPLDSAIILSRSGGEDSFKLHARDIIQHPIHARLVTVTACYGSGTRSYAGEGAVGLAWAFLRAGAHNVIGALWEVSDTSTPRLMGDLYQGLQKGLPPGVALRQAKLALLHAHGEFGKPFYWAPLQVYTGL